MSKRTQIDIYLCRHQKAKRAKKNTVYSWDDGGIEMTGTKKEYEAHLEKMKSEWIAKMTNLDLRLYEKIDFSGYPRGLQEFIAEFGSMIAK